MPGITIVDEMGKLQLDENADETVALNTTKKKTPSEFNAKAEKGIRDIVKKKHKDIIDGLETRAQSIGKSIEQFPVERQPDEDTTKAIKDGARTVQSITESL